MTDKEKIKIKPRYISQTGFIEVPILRGFTEIKHLYSLLEELFYNKEYLICGGYVRYMCSTNNKPVPASDVDIYFKHMDYFTKAKNNLLQLGLELKHENAISYTFKQTKDTQNLLYASPPIQLIKPVKDGAILTTGTLEEILNCFDFTVIRCGLLNQNKALVDADFIHDEGNKFLRLKNIHCPISSTLRCTKYARKGYWLSPLQASFLFLDWDSRMPEYKRKIIDSVIQMSEGEGLTKQQVDEMERLMMID